LPAVVRLESPPPASRTATESLKQLELALLKKQPNPNPPPFPPKYLTCGTTHSNCGISVSAIELIKSSEFSCRVSQSKHTRQNRNSYKQQSIKL
jgi:hypothetical protein